MRLEIKKGGKLDYMFLKEAVPEYVEDKATYYDMKKLQQWEQRYNEIVLQLKESDYREGMELLFALAEEGYPEARMLLSDMYIEGRVLPESFMKAVEWDRKAQYAEKLYREKPQY